MLPDCVDTLEVASYVSFVSYFLFVPQLWCLLSSNLMYIEESLLRIASYVDKLCFNVFFFFFTKYGSHSPALKCVFI